MASMDAILRVTAKGDASGLNGLVRGLESVKAAGANVSKSLGGIGSILGTVTGGVVALGAGLSAASLVTFAKGAIDAADNMRDLSQQTGASVENLSRFQQAANMSGTSIEAVGGAMVKLSRGMAEAAATGKGPAAEALRILGVSAVDAAGGLRGADQVMLDVAQRFQQMPDGAQKAALAVQLFGRSGAELIPMLNEGRQAIEGLGATMTTAFAEKADAYNDSLAAMGAVFGQIGMAIAEQFLPYLSSAVDWLTKVGIGIRDWIVANREPIRQTIETIGTIGAAIAPWVVGIGLVVTAYNTLTLATKAWATAQAIGQALSGPKGWAALAIGIAGAAVATGLVNQAMQAATSSSAAAALEASKISAEMGNIGAAATSIPPLIDSQTEAAARLKEETKAAKEQQEAFKVAVEASQAAYDVMSATVESTNQAIERQSKSQDAILDANKAINSASISILETKLRQARTDEEKTSILQRIQGLEIENARIDQRAQNAKIDAEVRRARFQVEKEKMELEELRRQFDIAKAMGQSTEQIAKQIQLQAIKVRDVKAEYEATVAIAEARKQATQAQVDAAIEIANAQKQASGSSSGIGYSGGGYSGGGGKVVRAPNGATIIDNGGQISVITSGTYGQGGIDPAKAALAWYKNGPPKENTIRTIERTNTIDSSGRLQGVGLPSGQYYAATGKFLTLAEGSYVDRATPGIFGEAGPEYVVPASKMRTASMAYLSGARGAAVLRGGSRRATAAPAPAVKVQVQTGPVMRMNGRDYVTLGDLEAAMKATATAVISHVQSSTGRLAMGGA